jgi:hypothetical protein
MKLHLLLLLSLGLLLAFTGIASVPAAEPAADITPATIDQLIADLDANEFAVRENASKKLAKVGLPAVDRLTQAATSKSLEQAHRSLGILEQMLDGDDAVADAAEQALSQVARLQNTWSAQRADLALQQTRLLKQRKCLDKIVALGAEVVDEGSDENGELNYLTLIIKQENWKGNDKDLRLLRNLPSLRSLSVFGPVFNESQLHSLSDLKELPALNLYATKLSNDGLAKLQTAMPYTRIDRRNGGMLGISGDQIGGNGCMVNTVQPGSAAAAAGIEAEDIVLSIDGKEVDSFSELTKMISEKSGGDVVKLKIKRGEQELDKEAKLGEWKPEHLKNGFRGGGNTIILQNGQRIIMAK